MNYFKKLIGDRIYLSPRTESVKLLLEYKFIGDYIRNKNIK